jgi:Protein of unknown function (DUF3717)
MQVTLQELEAAINWWRAQHPSEGHAMKLAPQVAALSRPYALLIWQRQNELPFTELHQSAMEALVAYRQAVCMVPVST